jgi:hypothetical protein
MRCQSAAGNFRALRRARRLARLRPGILQVRGGD